MRIPHLALILLVGCSPVSQGVHGKCITACGVTLMAGDDCAGFKAVEAEVISTLAAKTGWSDVCDAVSGTNVFVRNTKNGEWYSEHHKTAIIGETDCNLRLVYLGDSDWFHNAYIHEIAHVYECHKGWWLDSVAHKDWDSLGITAAVEEYRGKTR